MELLHVATALVSNLSRRMSRAARKLARRRHRRLLSLPACGRVKPAAKKTGDAELEQAKEGDDSVWRKAILMGEKCEPLDFSGVIYYDVDGRPLAEVPTPRSPLRSPLPSFAPKAAGYGS
ncbi:hypothetical protein Cni_G09920 [Canna indica]|uniref:Uncharacterized protein n=1 Tax=Canna indica TaxID=4628 RepID=A0AAQ3Q6W5_9LILI|nr:hypothetical protein Cni_G09920 [Canna indica]